MMPVLVLAVGLLSGVGVYLILARRIFSVILGLSLLTHAANLVMIAAAGFAERAPIVVDGVPPHQLADAVPQALVLTAIVISMAVTLYLLATYAAGVRRLGMQRVGPALTSDAGRDAGTVRRELSGESEGVE